MKEQVYFAASGGRIKIGTTRTGVDRRIAAISSHLPEPIHLVAAIDGGLPLERAIQSHLAAYRLRGEWFRDCQAVRDVIARLVLKGPDAIAYDGIMFMSERKALKVAGSADRPWNPAALGRVVHLMWGKDAVRKLAEFCETTETQAAVWIEDCTDMPRLTAMALSLVVMDWLRADADRDSLDKNTMYFVEYERNAGRDGHYLALQSRVGIPGFGAVVHEEISEADISDS